MVSRAGSAAAAAVPAGDTPAAGPATGARAAAVPAGDTPALAAISREAGLHKDWLSRYLERLDPATAAAVRRDGAGRPDAPWRPALARLGFGDVASYLRDRHAVRHWSVNAVAAEVGVSYHAVESALSRHGLDRVAPAAKRHAAAQRAARVAADLGFASVAEYVVRRRAAGWTWGAMADESGQPQSWLRRHAAAATPPPPPPPPLGPRAARPSASPGR